MVKKSVLALALCGLSVASAEQASGLFVGIGAGVPITTPSYGGALKSIQDILPNTGIGYNVSLMAGYRQALNQDMGLRYYAEYNYSESYGDGDGTLMGLMPAKTKADIKQQLATINVDYYYQATSAFSVYAGIGLGYQSFKPSWTPTIMGAEQNAIGGAQKGGLAVPLNIGASFNVNAHNQITLGAKIPLVAYDYKTSVPGATLGQQGELPANVKLRTYIVQIGYNYTF